MRLGRHMPRTLEGLRHAREMGCDAVQYFVTNPRAWQPPTPAPAEAATFRAALAEHGLGPAVVHAAYLINLASARPDVVENSLALLRTTLLRAPEYGAASVVVHVGSAGKADAAEGSARLVAGLRQVLDETPEGAMLLLENDTGGGGKLGTQFETLAALVAALPEHAPRLGLCLDSAHLWGAGYPLASAAEVEVTLAAAAAVLDLSRVRVLHLNDSRVGHASHRDVHARLGEGQIPLEALAAFARHPLLAQAVVLLETPFYEEAMEVPDWAAERAQIARARALAGLPPRVAPADVAADALPAELPAELPVAARQSERQ